MSEELHYKDDIDTVAQESFKSKLEVLKQELLDGLTAKNVYERCNLFCSKQQKRISATIANPHSRLRANGLFLKNRPLS